MDGYSYSGAYNGGTLDQHNDAETMMMMMGQDGSMGNLGAGNGSAGGTGGQSLDDIVNENAKMMRRQSMPQGFGSSPHNINPDMRRISMMDYGDGSPVNFHYDPSPRYAQNTLPQGPSTAGNQRAQAVTQQNPRRESSGDLSLETNFVGTPQQNYSSMMPPNTAYTTSPAHAAPGVDVNMENSPYLDTNLGMNIDYNADPNLSIPQASMQMNLYNQPQFNQQTLSSPMHPPMQQNSPHTSGRMSSHDAGITSGQSSMYGGLSSGNSAPTVRATSGSQSLHVPDNMTPATNQSPMSAPQHSGSGRSPLSGISSQVNNAFPAQPQRPLPQQDLAVTSGMNGGPPLKYKPTNQNFPWDAPDGGWPSSMSGRPHMASAYKNAYSSTGFDMLGVLVSIWKAEW